ncbi:sulfur carrier protein ThiS [Vibrio sp.]|nr:sulfur carrier protein ThiS [Vibrio sp.]
MHIVINGDSVSFDETNLQHIIMNWGAKPPYAVAVNGDFITELEYQKIQIQAGDRIDIVSPIFGG